MASQNQVGDIDNDQDDTSQADENQNERVWKLKDCKMTVGVYGKRRAGDASMIVDLVFEFDDEPTPKVVGELNEIFTVANGCPLEKPNLRSIWSKSLF